MTLRMLTLEGPLPRERLEWIAALYGPVDAKYADRSFLEHLFVRTPAAPSLHVFAVDGDLPVGHCAVVPMAAREGSRTLLCGKVEALVVAEGYRGRRDHESPVAVQMRESLFELAGTEGIEVLHAYVQPPVARILGLAAVAVGPRSLVAVVRPGGLERSLRRRLLGTALATLQAALRAPLAPWGRGSHLRAATERDADLVEVPPEPGRWTAVVEGTWSWYCASPYVRVLDGGGKLGGRALVQLPGSPGDPFRLVAWKPEREGLLPALILLARVARVARSSGAATLRFQSLPNRPTDATLARACRLLGFVARDDFTTLSVRSPDPRLARADAITWTPLFSLGF